MSVIPPLITHRPQDIPLYESSSGGSGSSFPIIAYTADVPEYATDFYYNGQTLPSVAAGTASALVRFDTTSSAVFTAVALPDAIKTGLQNPAYTFLEVSGTIPLYMQYNLNPNANSNGVGRLTCQGTNAGGATAKEMTFWFSASNQPAQSPTPIVGDTYYFNFPLKIGESVLPDSTAVQFILVNPDTQNYAAGYGSSLTVGGGGIAAASVVLQFKLY